MQVNGIVKEFNGGQGLVNVIRDGKETGEELYFDMDQTFELISGRYKGCNPFVGWTDEKADVAYLGREPRVGDVLILELGWSSYDAHAREVRSWTFRSLWDAELADATTQPPIGNNDPDRGTYTGYVYVSPHRLAVMRQHGDYTG